MISIVAPFQKLKEVAYIHSEGILAGELKHGSLALIDKDMPVIMVVVKDATYDVSMLIRYFNDTYMYIVSLYFISLEASQRLFLHCQFIS